VLVFRIPHEAEEIVRRALSGPERLAMLATEHAGCSAHVDQARFVEAIVPPCDRGSGRLDAFVGRRPPNTSVLLPLGLYRLAGLSDKLLLSPHQFAGAAIRLLRIASAHRAWIEGNCASPFQVGDVWVAFGPPTGIHMGVCVSDALVMDDGTWVVDTVEGGQVEDERD
jgi:hypothetical protein